MTDEFEAGSLDAMLRDIGDWAERGWIRRLDAAVARFVEERCMDPDGEVVLATALLANLEGHGHTCLDLDALIADPERTTGWTGDALEALRRSLATLPKSADEWSDSLTRCDAVYVDGGFDEDTRGEPLVLSGDTLYLRRYWTHERRVAASVRKRGSARGAIDERAVRRWLDRLFPPLPGVASGTDWQKVACAIALRGRLSIITGGPGTGKTHTAARLLALSFATAAEPGRLRVALAAPTGKAAARLKQSIDGALAGLEARLGDTLPLVDLASRIGPARTLHALLGTRRDSRRFRHDANHPLDVDVVIVDEASMIQVEMMDALLAALPDTTRVVLLGDKDQLASVEAGAVLGELCHDADAGRYDASTTRYVEAVTGERIPDAFVDDNGPGLAQVTVMLRRSQRFGGAVGKLAQAVNAGDAATASGLLDTAPVSGVSWVSPATPDAVIALAAGSHAGGGYRDYLETMRRRPAGDSMDSHRSWVRDVLKAFDAFRVLCAVREGDWGVSGLNRAIADRLAEYALIAPDNEWYEGRPILVGRNDYDLGVFNGDIGIALRAEPADGGLRAWFVEGPTVRSVSVSRLAHVDTAFAMTVHKSQGSEFDHTVLVLPPEPNPVTTRELVYTGVTRARTAFTLVSSRREALAEAIAQTTRRGSGLSTFIREGEADRPNHGVFMLTGG